MVLCLVESTTILKVNFFYMFCTFTKEQTVSVTKSEVLDYLKGKNAELDVSLYGEIDFDGVKAPVSITESSGKVVVSISCRSIQIETISDLENFIEHYSKILKNGFGLFLVETKNSKCYYKINLYNKIYNQAIALAKSKGCENDKKVFEDWLNSSEGKSAKIKSQIVDMENVISFFVVTL